MRLTSQPFRICNGHSRHESHCWRFNFDGEAVCQQTFCMLHNAWQMNFIARANHTKMSSSQSHQHSWAGMHTTRVREKWFHFVFGSSWHRQKAISRNLFVYPRRGRKNIKLAIFSFHISLSFLMCFKNKYREKFIDLSREAWKFLFLFSTGMAALGEKRWNIMKSSIALDFIEARSRVFDECLYLFIFRFCFSLKNILGQNLNFLAKYNLVYFWEAQTIKQFR